MIDIKDYILEFRANRTGKHVELTTIDKLTPDILENWLLDKGVNVLKPSSKKDSLKAYREFGTGLCYMSTLCMTVPSDDVEYLICPKDKDFRFVIGFKDKKCEYAFKQEQFIDRYDTVWGIRYDEILEMLEEIYS